MAVAPICRWATYAQNDAAVSVRQPYKAVVRLPFGAAELPCAERVVLPSDIGDVGVRG